MENFLIGKGFWDLVIGDEPEPRMLERNAADQQKAHKTWLERARKLLHWLSICILDAMGMQIMNCKSPKDAWVVLTRYYGTTTSARKPSVEAEVQQYVKKGEVH